MHLKRTHEKKESLWDPSLKDPQVRRSIVPTGALNKSSLELELAGQAMSVMSKVKHWQQEGRGDSKRAV